MRRTVRALPVALAAGAALALTGPAALAMAAAPGAGSASCAPTTVPEPQLPGTTRAPAPAPDPDPGGGAGRVPGPTARASGSPDTRASGGPGKSCGGTGACPRRVALRHGLLRSSGHGSASRGPPGECAASRSVAGRRDRCVTAVVQGWPVAVSPFRGRRRARRGDEGRPVGRAPLSEGRRGAVHWPGWSRRARPRSSRTGTERPAPVRATSPRVGCSGRRWSRSRRCADMAYGDRPPRPGDAAPTRTAQFNPAGSSAGSARVTRCSRRGRRPRSMEQNRSTLMSLHECTSDAHPTPVSVTRQLAVQRCRRSFWSADRNFPGPLFPIPGGASMREMWASLRLPSRGPRLNRRRAPVHHAPGFDHRTAPPAGGRGRVHDTRVRGANRNRRRVRPCPVRNVC